MLQKVPSDYPTRHLEWALEKKAANSKLHPDK